MPVAIKDRGPATHRAEAETQILQRAKRDDDLRTLLRTGSAADASKTSFRASTSHDADSADASLDDAIDAAFDDDTFSTECPLAASSQF